MGGAIGLAGLREIWAELLGRRRGTEERGKYLGSRGEYQGDGKGVRRANSTRQDAKKEDSSCSFKKIRSMMEALSHKM